MGNVGVITQLAMIVVLLFIISLHLRDINMTLQQIGKQQVCGQVKP